MLYKLFVSKIDATKVGACHSPHKGEKPQLLGQKPHWFETPRKQEAQQGQKRVLCFCPCWASCFFGVSQYPPKAGILIAQKMLVYRIWLQIHSEKTVALPTTKRLTAIPAPSRNETKYTPAAQSDTSTRNTCASPTVFCVHTKRPCASKMAT